MIMLSFLVLPAAAQDIIVPAAEPCFNDLAAGVDILKNCDADQDVLGWVLGPWQWITGGYFTMIFVSVIIGAVYIKYHQAALAMFIGIVYLPVAWVLFPQQFLSWAIIMVGLTIGVLIWYIYVRQTR